MQLAMHKNAHARKLRDLTAPLQTRTHTTHTHSHTHTRWLTNTHTQFKLWTKLRDSCLVYRRAPAPSRRVFTLLFKWCNLKSQWRESLSYIYTL